LTSQGKQRNELLNQIIGLEAEMFVNVPTAEPAACQERLKPFRAMRRMTHSPLSDGTLQSYLGDLLQAKADGRNLLQEKYARMDDLIPCLNDNPLIAKIAQFEMRCLDDLSARYPQLIASAATTDPGLYLTSELETLSDDTLNHYFEDVANAMEEGRNLAEERYIYLCKILGYGSLDEWHKAKTG